MEIVYRLSRVVRTPSSEIYVIWCGEERVGQVDVHYAGDTIHATLILERDLEMELEEMLLELLDRDVITSYLPKFDRDDLVVYVFRGEQVNRYTDHTPEMDEMEWPDDEDEDIFGDEEDEDEDDEEDGLG